MKSIAVKYQNRSFLPCFGGNWGYINHHHIRYQAINCRKVVLFLMVSPVLYCSKNCNKMYFKIPSATCLAFVQALTCLWIYWHNTILDLTTLFSSMSNIFYHNLGFMYIDKSTSSFWPIFPHIALTIGYYDLTWFKSLVGVQSPMGFIRQYNYHHYIKNSSVVYLLHKTGVSLV